MLKDKIKVKVKNKDVSGVKCHAHFYGKDGLGTCNTECQWWSDEYLNEGDLGCPLWDVNLMGEIKMLEERCKLLEALEKENAELIIDSEGMELKIAELDKENSILKAKLDKDRVMRILENYMSELSGDVNCVYFKAVANEIIGGEE